MTSSEQYADAVEAVHEWRDSERLATLNRRLIADRTGWPGGAAEARERRHEWYGATPEALDAVLSTWP